MNEHLRSELIGAGHTGDPATGAGLDRGRSEQVIELRLYIAGQTASCVRAVDSLQRLCEEFLPGKSRVELIDLSEDPTLARDDDVVAVPTLVRKHPPPIRTLIGDLSNKERVLGELLVRPEAGTTS